MSATSQHKRRLLEQLAGVAKALGHEYRLELLELVMQSERSVEALTELTGLPVATVSQHLQQLKRGGLAVARREGKYVYYRVADDSVTGLLDALRAVAEKNLAEVRHLVREFTGEARGLESITREELLKRLKEDSIVLLDVRPAEEYAAGHLPGAINIPADELEAHLAELPADREIVAYCRGPYCALSVEAVEILGNHGLKARRLDDGYASMARRASAG